MNNDKSKQYDDFNINLRQIFMIIKERSRFIFGFTGFVSLITFLFVLSMNPVPVSYTIKASFLKPSSSSITKLNKYSLLNEAKPASIKNKTDNAILPNTAVSVFNKFLTTLNSSALQREAFDDGGYAEKLGKGAFPSILISKDKEFAGVGLPHILSTTSLNPDSASEFLNEVLAKADEKTVKYFINLQKLQISNRLNVLTKKRQLLLAKSKKDRLSQIKRIKEADKQRLQEINNKIAAARLIARTERMNQIVVLSDAAQLATILGIVDNNLNQLGKGINSTNLNIAIQSGTDIPDWYLYGETVLLEMIALLKSRESDDPYIPELAVLDNQINEINNNTLLQTLEQRLDDSPFNSEISQLDIETIQLELISPDSTGINAMQLYEAATIEINPTSSRNRLIIALAIIGSFILSILLVFLMNAFKEEDATSIQKGK